MDTNSLGVNTQISMVIILSAIDGIWVGHLLTLEEKLQCLDIGID